MRRYLAVVAGACVGDDVASTGRIIDTVHVPVLSGRDARAVPVGCTISAREEEVSHFVAARDRATRAACVAARYLGGRLDRVRRDLVRGGLGRLGQGVRDHLIGGRRRIRHRAIRDDAVAMHVVVDPQHADDDEAEQTDQEDGDTEVSRHCRLADLLLDLGRALDLLLGLELFRRLERLGLLGSRFRVEPGLFEAMQLALLFTTHEEHHGRRELAELVDEVQMRDALRVLRRADHHFSKLHLLPDLEDGLAYAIPATQRVAHVGSVGGSQILHPDVAIRNRKQCEQGVL